MIIKPEGYPAECPHPGLIKINPDTGKISFNFDEQKMAENEAYFEQIKWVCDNCLTQAGHRHIAGWHTFTCELTSHGGGMIGSLEEELMYEAYNYTLENATHFCTFKCAGDHFHKLDGMGGLDIQYGPAS